MYEQVEKTQVKKSQMAANAVSQRRNSNAPTSRFVDKRPEAIQMRKLRDLAKHSPQKATLRELHNLAAAHSVAQKKSNGKQGFVFVDNRPEAIAQRKLQEMANNSPQVSQLKANQNMANNCPVTKQAVQLQAMADNYPTRQQQPIQKKASPEPSRRENNTGLPDNLKNGIENLSGYSMDDVKVHKNSNKPAQLQAHAYAQGTDIHLGPGQEKHLPHEAWHVVQQKQGRVKSTMQMKSGVFINDDQDLEKEADKMGEVVQSATIFEPHNQLDTIKASFPNSSSSVQRFVYHKVDSRWEKVELKEAPPILIDTLGELTEIYKDPGVQEVISNIFESEENKILLYRLDDKAAIVSEIAALIEKVNKEPEEEKKKKAGGGWRTGKADKEFKEAAKHDKEGFATGHHKLAKSKIQWFYDLLTKEQKANLRARLDLPSTSGVNALKSLYSNLTFGPGSGDREDDPKRALDPNFHKIGPLRKMSLRSEQYHEVDQIIARIGGPPEIDPEKKSIPAPEYEEIAKCFEQAEKLHAIITDGGGIDTDKSMWTRSETELEEWVKQDFTPPTELPEGIQELLKPSVRDLKAEKHRATEDGFSLTQEDRVRLIEQLHPAHREINRQLETDPENIPLRVARSLIMHEKMVLLRVSR